MLTIHYVQSQAPDYCKNGLCNACVRDSLSCEKPGLTQIPSQLSPHTRTFLLSKQAFLQTYLTKDNFSLISPPHVNLVRLHIRSTNIKYIHSKTFSSLTTLKFLDFSHHINLTIHAYAFAGLKLKLLKLDQNYGLNLNINAFQDTSIESLHMSQSSISILPYELLKPILPSLKTLFLKDNNLTIIDSRFELSFKSFNQLYLQNNPINCCCSMQWLTDVFNYRKKLGKFERSAFNQELESPPICAEPNYLRGQKMNKIQFSNFNCDSPILNQMKIDFTSASESKLSCSAIHPIIQSSLQVKWFSYLKSNNLDNNQTKNINDYFNKNKYYKQYTDTIHIKQRNEIDTFKCIAKNINGNVTAIVRISWPKKPIRKITPKPIDNNNNNNNQRPTLYSNDWSTKQQNIPEQINDEYLFQKRFTLLEMLGAVIGTFSLTLLMFFLLYKLFFMKRNNKLLLLPRKSLTTHHHPQPHHHHHHHHGNSATSNMLSGNGYTTYDAAIYNDSLTYDIPGNTIGGGPVVTTTTGTTNYPAHTVLLPMPHLNNNNNNTTTTTTHTTSTPDHFLDFKTQRKLYSGN